MYRADVPKIVRIDWLRSTRLDAPMTLAALTAFTLIAFLARGAMAAGSKLEQISRARQESTGIGQET